MVAKQYQPQLETDGVRRANEVCDAIEEPAMNESLDEWQQALMSLSAFEDEIARRNQQEQDNEQAARGRFFASSDG